jgi:hypothetical protein
LVALYAIAGSFLHIHILLPTHVHVNPGPSKDGTNRGRIEGRGRVVGSRLCATIGSWVDVSIGGVRVVDG